VRVVLSGPEVGESVVSGESLCARERRNVARRAEMPELTSLTLRYVTGDERGVNLPSLHRKKGNANNAQNGKSASSWLPISEKGHFRHSWGVGGGQGGENVRKKKICEANLVVRIESTPQKRSGSMKSARCHVPLGEGEIKWERGAIPKPYRVASRSICVMAREEANAGAYLGFKGVRREIERKGTKIKRRRKVRHIDLLRNREYFNAIDAIASVLIGRRRGGPRRGGGRCSCR